jgi:phage terminase Nu1 subunit (DNA packaging protein)
MPVPATSCPVGAKALKDRLRGRAAGALVDDIEEAVRFIRKRCRFASEADRALARFEEGRRRLARITAGDLIGPARKGYGRKVRSRVTCANA